MFWDSFSLHSKRAAGQIFCKSPCAGFLVVVQPGDAQEPGATLDFDASIKLVERMETGIQVPPPPPGGLGIDQSVSSDAS